MCCCKEVDFVNSDFVTKFDCIIIRTMSIPWNMHWSDLKKMLDDCEVSDFRVSTVLVIPRVHKR